MEKIWSSEFTSPYLDVSLEHYGIKGMKWRHHSSKGGSHGFGKKKKKDDLADLKKRFRKAKRSQQKRKTKERIKEEAAEKVYRRMLKNKATIHKIYATSSGGNHGF